MSAVEVLSLVTEVSRRLRTYGVKCGTSESLDAYRALGFTPIKSVEHLKQVLRLCVIKRLEDYEIFDRIFDELQKQKRPSEQMRDGQETGQRADMQKRTEKSSTSRETQKQMTVYYSPIEVLMKKDLPTPTLSFLRESKRVMKRFRRRMALLPGRRFERSSKGPIDFGETIRQSLRTQGEILRVLRRRRKVTRCKLVAIFDVSGSMDTYTEFLMQSMYALARQTVSVEVFVFSTKLMKVSSLLKYFGPKKAAELISRDVNIWGSGTRIGSCLSTFIEKHRGLVGKGTVALIVSDGWDTGEPEVLERSMRNLKTMVGRIVWINPHADKPGFKPRTIGMETAMPYIDVLAGMNALKSLRGFKTYFGTALEPMGKKPFSRPARPSRQ
ncbi:MAG: VWA domain-containing protein [Candidatus Caldarchaeum sp.]|nr:VWA domain-containing protein [Candidatus Caldarchaeum sp.]MDW8435439.1 VWA domain-containing protein [Candidatus Caldarchaeum sp.]